MARAGLGWTNRQLAEKAQVAPNTVSSFERGRHIQPSSKQAIELALLSSNQVRFEGADWVCITDTEPDDYSTPLNLNP